MDAMHFSGNAFMLGLAFWTSSSAAGWSSISRKASRSFNADDEFSDSIAALIFPARRRKPAERPETAADANYFTHARYFEPYSARLGGEITLRTARWWAGRPRSALPRPA